MQVPIDNRSDLSRDIRSMGIINTNKNNWKAAQTRKLVEVRKNTEINNLKSQINELDNKLNLILSKMESIL